MIELSIDTLADLLDAEITGDATTWFRGVTSDSRKHSLGRLYVAIRGENFDGHHFVAAAAENGAAAALVETVMPVDLPQIRVDDTVAAMGRIANYWRHACPASVIALTGSNGKTTVKEMLERILSSQAPTLATRGNYNNAIGVPLTLFELSPQDRYAIIEMGANHAGEIALLATIAEPDIVLVNNASDAHLEGFGSLQGIRDAKGELYDYCSTAQAAVFNLDDVASDQWQAGCAAGTCLTCALDSEADVGASWRAESGGLEIEFHYRDERASCRLALLGEHNVRNGLAAMSLALLAGLDLATAAAALDGFAGVRGRLQIRVGPNGSRLLDDTYNANPTSLLAGLRVLTGEPGEAWLALGDMGELGDEAENLHRQAGVDARELGVQRLYGHGPLSCLAAEAFGDAGFCCDDIDNMATTIGRDIHAGVNLLVKGSRAAAMERLVERLVAGNGEAGQDAV